MHHIRNLAVIGAVVLNLTSCNASVVAGVGQSEQIQASGLTADARSVNGRRYLYVDRQTYYHRQLLERYLLRDGLPDKSPGFTIRLAPSFGYSSQIAVGGDGTLFMMVNGAGPIFAFARNAHEPERAIEIAQKGPCVRNPSRSFFTTTIAADERGYVFVQFVTYGTDGKPLAARDLPANAVCDGVWVYAPGANGYARPAVTIALKGVQYSTAMSVDPSDNLYIALDQSTVVEYSNATTQAIRTRVFHGPGRFRQLVATNESGDAFIATTKGTRVTEHINRFTASDDPPDGPASSIDVQSSPLVPMSMAALARHVYIVNDDELGVEIYHAYQNGPQAPIALLRAKNVGSFVVGP